MPLLAIDPGLRGTGWALFEDEVLRSCGVAGSSDGTLWDRAKEIVEGISTIPKHGRLEMVVEKPQVYQQRSAKGDPNDLVDLGILIGVLVHAFNPHEARLVRPRDWKGTIPKTAKLENYIIHKRVLGKLRGPGLKSYELGLATLPGYLRHNLADAVGIGLWSLQQVRLPV